MKMTARFVLALSTLMLIGSAAAHPSRVGEVPTKTVSFRDLDLSTSQGAQALYVRLKDAAREVCAGAELAEFDACRARAIEDAVKDVGSPLLSAVQAENRFEEVALR
jgi:UrcA family protein